MIVSRVEPINPCDRREYAWSGLRRFQNIEEVANRIIQAHSLGDRHRANALKQAKQIRYCLIQAQEYFDAAQTVSLATKPNLIYYGTMSLALAEILFKQSGDSSLDKARQEHKHHGLLFSENLPKKKTIQNLSDAAGALSAFPMEVLGRRRGTFHLWHRSARESPLCGLVSTNYVEGGGTKHTDIILGAIDVALEEIPNSGLTLANCLAAIPAMAEFVLREGIEPTLGRGRVEKRIRVDQSWEISLIFHPGSVVRHLFENLRVPPEWVTCMDVTQIPQGFVVKYRISELTPSRVFHLPSGCMFHTDEFRFWKDNRSLNEFGLYYVALFICGNLARYYPDYWLREVEKSTPIARAIENLCSQAEQWLPWLALGELSQMLIVMRQ